MPNLFSLTTRLQTQKRRPKMTTHFYKEVIGRNALA